MTLLEEPRKVNKTSILPFEGREQISTKVPLKGPSATTASWPILIFEGIGFVIDNFSIFFTPFFFFDVI